MKKNQHVHTGVYNFTQVEMSYLDEGIDMDYEDALLELVERYGSEENIPDEEWANLEDFTGSTFLFGDWVMRKSHKVWEVNRRGKHGYAAIANADKGTIQVVWSKTIRYGIPASACYPNQVDAQADDPAKPEGGQALEVNVFDQLHGHPQPRAYAYYALPDWLLIKEEEGYEDDSDHGLLV